MANKDTEEIKRYKEHGTPKWREEQQKKIAGVPVKKEEKPPKETKKN